jgi:DtxR family transcriptional regulator, Mn-dependent transcriptional regulator
VVGRVDDRDDALLRFLAERGLVPDAGVEVLGHAPFGGPISIRVDDGHVVDVPPAAADAVHVV